MTTIAIEVSAERLLREVEQLTQHELETFVAQIVDLRAQGNALHL